MRTIDKLKVQLHLVSPLDMIINITGKNNVCIWNGVNDKRHFLFKSLNEKDNKGIDDPDTQWIGLSLGKLSDSGMIIPAVVLYFNSDACAVACELCSPYNKTFKDNEISKDCRWLTDRIQDNKPIRSRYKKTLEKWIKGLFTFPPKVRYRKQIFCEDILNPEKDKECQTIMKNLGEENLKYMKAIEASAYKRYSLGSK